MKDTSRNQVHQTSSFLKSIAARVLMLLLAGLTLPGARGDVTFTTLASFSGVNGDTPSGPLTLGMDGNIYGTTKYGGTGYGTVFKLTPDGTLTALFAFDGVANGRYPLGGLVQRADGVFYGTTSGSGSDGTVFKLTPDGTFSNLVKVLFNNPIIAPNSLIQGADGNLYGTVSTTTGITDKAFKVTTNNNAVTTVGFSPSGAFGYFPNRLAQGSNGNFYGTTQANGTNTSGMIFQMTPGLAVTPLFLFQVTNGASPWGGLVLGTDGKFYGTTAGGGAYINRHVPFGDRYGTAFQFSTNGTVSTLHSFDNTNGAFPVGELLQGKDGNFYGVTRYGGSSYTNAAFGLMDGYGTVFSIATDGTFTSLFSFNGLNGSLPLAGLVQDADGNLYGTTSTGGDYGHGTIFRLSITPAPPVFQSVNQTGGSLTFTWSSITGRSYQVQSTIDPTQPDWRNVGGPLIATNVTATASDSIGSDLGQFYRVALLPP